MRVMVSLNLADIMTATRPRTSQPRREALDNEADPTEIDRREPLEPNHCEPFDREPGTIPTQA
jgi:hypothetical protein